MPPVSDTSGLLAPPARKSAAVPAPPSRQAELGARRVTVAVSEERRTGRSEPVDVVLHCVATLELSASSLGC